MTIPCALSLLNVCLQANEGDFVEYQPLELDSLQLSLQFTEFSPSTSSNSSSTSSNSSISVVKEFIAQRKGDSSVHVCLQIVSQQSIDGAQASSNGQRWSAVDYRGKLNHLVPVKVVLTRCDGAEDVNDVLKPVIRYFVYVELCFMLRGRGALMNFVHYFHISWRRNSLFSDFLGGEKFIIFRFLFWDMVPPHPVFEG